MPIKVDIVSPDRRLYSGEVEMVTLPGSNGQMGILHGHAPLLSTLDIGEIVLHRGEGNDYLAVSGGVVEVRPDKVTVLADVAEAGEEIDEARCPCCTGTGTAAAGRKPTAAQIARDSGFAAPQLAAA
jgi:F-type H+-transporting ATPase subunit epsilon